MLAEDFPTQDPESVISFRKDNKLQLKDIPSPPDPFLSFNVPGLPEFVLDTIKLNGFKAWTPVQAQAIPIIMTGRDFIGISKTGSGKTLAFLIPALVRLTRDHKGERNGPFVLVLSPTRELACQIEEEFRKFLFRSSITWACVYGGIKKDLQRSSLIKGIQILVATPGRLLDFVEEGAIRLDKVSYFVLDEADRMLDMGFIPQVKEIMSYLKPERQILMFSATWPFQIKSLADRFMNKPASLQVGELERTVNDMILQEIKLIKGREKFEEITRDMGLTKERKLVFVQRKIDVEKLCDALEREGFRCCSIHGDKAQQQRDKALSLFKQGKVKLLVATDVASRGLDIPDVELVVNYDFPSQIEDYIHRIGRTGRAGKSGRAISYLAEGIDNRIAEDLIKVMREAKQQVPENLISFSRRRGGESRYEKFNNKGRFGR